MNEPHNPEGFPDPPTSDTTLRFLTVEEIAVLSDADECNNEAATSLHKHLAPLKWATNRARWIPADLFTFRSTHAWQSQSFVTHMPIAQPRELLDPQDFPDIVRRFVPSGLLTFPMMNAGESEVYGCLHSVQAFALMLQDMVLQNVGSDNGAAVDTKLDLRETAAHMGAIEASLERVRQILDLTRNETIAVFVGSLQPSES